MRYNLSGINPMETVYLNADVAVVGASLGGTIAALSAARQGCSVLLFEETDWIGGQLTTQAVPPDEHAWIEQFGCTASYREYRNRVRASYRSHPFFIDALKTRSAFCPASSTVSRLSHPPKLALRILNEMLGPYLDNGRLQIHYLTRLESVTSGNDAIRSITMRCGDRRLVVTANCYLDGTDTGELIAESGAAYTTGAESRAQTGERLAPERANPADMQPATWAAAVALMPGGDFVIDRPAEYEYFHRLKVPYDDVPLLSMYGPDSRTGRAKRFGLFDGERGADGKPLFALWSYRRIVCAANFRDGYEPCDATILNWPQNDYYLGNLFESADAEEHVALSKQLTLSLLYWLQTEAERPDGGRGWRNLKLCPDLMGTEDGLAKAPYIRESRRIRSLFPVTAEQIAEEGALSPDFSDSVGIGSYPIDLHITTATHTFLYRPSRRFRIPLGALLPERYTNLLPACKNIGTTHLTNGCYRLHPVEWNVGEAAGLLAAYSLREQIGFREIYENGEALKAFQQYLRAEGIPLTWEEYDGKNI